MTCSQCRGLDNLFDAKTAAKELKAYRKKGTGKTTRMLLDALKSEGVEKMTLLDIGGGVGAVQHELLAAGVEHAINVDASRAYIKAAQDEAQQRGYANRMSYHHGNFVDMAPNIAPVDIVTLDRAICCYHDMPALVGSSSAKAGRLYGVVYPRDSWWLKLGVAVINFFSRLTRKEYRFFVHPAQAVESILHHNGLNQCFYQKTFLWQIAVYTR